MKHGITAKDRWEFKTSCLLRSLIIAVTHGCSSEIGNVPCTAPAPGLKRISDSPTATITANFMMAIAGVPMGPKTNDLLILDDLNASAKQKCAFLFFRPGNFRHFSSNEENAEKAFFFALGFCFLSLSPGPCISVHTAVIVVVTKRNQVTANALEIAMQLSSNSDCSFKA